MRFGALSTLLLPTVLLHGCAVALLPVVAAGAIGKTQVDAAQARTRAAERQLADLPVTEREAVVTVAPTENHALPPPESEEQNPQQSDAPPERVALADINQPYLPMARYALTQAERRQAGSSVRSAVLVEQVSLIEPRAVDCADKPSAIIIDMDEAPGVELSDGEATGFGELLQFLRDNGIVIAWASDRSTGGLADDLAVLQAGEVPPMHAEDIHLFAWPGLRKQERRWNFAATHCVLAIAGDRKSDFDELFDYLRDPDYAIRLDAWIDKGWFLLPYPAAVAAANLSPKATEVDTPDDNP